MTVNSTNNTKLDNKTPVNSQFYLMTHTYRNNDNVVSVHTNKFILNFENENVL